MYKKNINIFIYIYIFLDPLKYTKEAAIGQNVFLNSLNILQLWMSKKKKERCK